MGGVDVWGEITIDVKRGIVYLATASAKYELYGGDRHGDNLYADCMLALDARTGKRLWHFQTVHHDLWDTDPAAAPQLATVRHEGKTVDAVALASKNGFLYVFDRVSGKPLWPIEERPVPKSDVPGEFTAPTQPFPTVVPPFSRQSMTVKDMYDAFMTDEQKVWWKDRLIQGAHRIVYATRVRRHHPHPQRQRRRAVLRQRARTRRTERCMSLGKDMPSIIKLVPAGESTGVQCRRADSRPAAQRTGRATGSSADGRTARPHGVRAELPGLSWP